ncbi:hypothetical protein BGZ91_007734, partial [Linnemannia elongata]
TPAIFGLPSTPMTSLEHQQQQQQHQQQAHLSLQNWHGLRPKVEYDTSNTSTTIVERATQDPMTATGHLRCSLAQQQSSEYSMENHGQLQARGVTPFDRSFQNNSQGQVVQEIQESTRGPMSSSLNSNSSTGVVSRQQENQVRVQRSLLQDETHQHPSSDVEDLDGEAFDSSLAMVLDDHLSLMDHLNMMPDVEVYQDQLSSAASMMRLTEQQQPQPQQQHQKISVSTSIFTGMHHQQQQQQRFQGPMSAPVISTHHQNLFGSSELYPAPASATPANNTFRSTVYPALSDSSVPSPVSSEDPTTGGELVMIKQEFGHQAPHPLQQQQQQPMLYFDNSPLVMSEGPQSAGSSTGSNGDSTTGSGGGSGSFGYVQDTSFMHIKVEPDLDLDSQHQLKQQQHHQQQQQQQQPQSLTASSSYYTTDRQHPFDVTPVQPQHQHRHQQQQQQQHQFQNHHPQGGRLNQSTTVPTVATATTHGVPILVAEYSHRPHQQQQQ